MTCEHCGGQIEDGEGAVVRVEWVGRWKQDVRNAQIERRRGASANAVLCARCGERVVDATRRIVLYKTESQQRTRTIARDDAA